MKNKLKKILILLIMTVGMFLYPYKINAEGTIPYHNVAEEKHMLINDIYFSNVVYKDHSETSVLAYGLIGNIVNNSEEEKDINIIVTFYDENYNIISTNTHNKIMQPRQNETYIQMLSTDSIKEGCTTANIMYYTIEVKNNTKGRLELTPSKLEEYSKYPYVIDKYNIKIKVNDDNSFDITEKITVFFKEERHGIYRNIPTINNVNRLNGKKTSNTARVSDVTVDEKFTTSREMSTYQIKIGNKNKTLKGEKTYKINYKYKIGKDPLKNMDEFYFNLIGTGWTDTVIGNITFEIDMPKDFDASKLGFSAGTYGSLNTDKISYKVKDKTITGKYNDILKGSEALTVRIELDEDYFKDSVIYSILDYLLFVIPTLFLIISIKLWNKYGKDEPVVEVINFYPPENLNSLELAFKYKGKATETDVVSLLIYLANKGYLKITEEKFSTLSYGDFSIQKLKEYDGDNEYERQFFNALWKHKKKTKAEIKMLSEREKELNELDNVITSNDLKYKFHSTIGKIQQGVNSKKNKNKLFVNRTKKKKPLLIIFMTIIYLITVLIPTYGYGSLYDLTITLIVILMGLPFLLATTADELPWIIKVFFATTAIFIIGVSTLGLPLSTAIESETIYLISTIYGFICIFGIYLCTVLLPKRTPYGNEILGQIKGFKTFLEVAEKDQLEVMVEENPNYFYDILPYTYVLGISNKWIKKFESISVEEPDWYRGARPFNMHNFNRSLNRTFSQASTSMSSAASSGGSSGSSSGGGFSGGGSGGGGGGSW